MKIHVKENFGLNGQDLRKGETIDVDPAHFGDNLQAFRDAGLFEEAEDDEPEPTPEPEPIAEVPEPVAIAESIPSVQTFAPPVPAEEPLAVDQPQEPTA